MQPATTPKAGSAELGPSAPHSPCEPHTCKARDPSRLTGTRLALMLVLALGAALPGCRCDREPPRGEPGGPSDGPPRTIPTDAMPARRVWTEEAKQAKIAPEHIARVERLLLEAQPAAERMLTRPRAAALRGAVRTFLGAESTCFTTARAAAHPDYGRRKWLVEGKCYWAAWLMAEAVRHPQMTQARSDEVRTSFQALTDALAKPLDPAEARRARRQMARAFDRLHGDALFPALREPITAAERKELLGRPADMKGLPVRSLVARVLFELTFDRIRPGQTEYWGHMKVADYGPADARWPVSLAFVPDDEMNRLTGWSRGGGIAETRPGHPTTGPATAKTPPPGTVESDWSPAVAGLRGRLTAGPYLARRLSTQVVVRVWSVAEGPLELDVAFAGSLHWKLTDAAGKEIKPASQPTSASVPRQRWQQLQPGHSAGKIAGGSRWDRTGQVVLELSSTTWGLPPGTYKLHCTLKVSRSSAAGQKSPWVGEMVLAPAEFEVFPEVDDDALRTAAAAVRAEHGKGPKRELWRALARLVTPGMTPDQMLIVLPPAPRQRPKTEDHGGYFFLSYPLDLQHDVKAVGVLRGPAKDQRILTSRPVLIPKETSTDASVPKE